MRLGIYTAYINRYGLREGAMRMRAHGYECLDYQNFIRTDSDFFQLPEREFEAQIKEERYILESEGIDVWQAHGPWRYSFKDKEAAQRGERFEEACKAIRGSVYLGAERFIMHPLMPYGHKSSEGADKIWEINLEFMSRLCEVAKEYGIVICYENMPFPLFPITTVPDVTKLSKQINSPYFKVCLDTGHCLVCGESPADAVRYLGRDMLGAMHVHDNDGLSDQHMPLGTGVGDWISFGKALSDIGYDGVVSFETGAGDSPDETEQEALELKLADWGRLIAGIK